MTYSISFFRLGSYVSVIWWVCGGCNCVEDDACMPTIRYHHLYNIRILVIISCRVVDAFGPVFSSSPSCLLSAFPYPSINLQFLYLFPRFRAGPSIAVSRSNGPSFTFFFLSLSSHTSYPACMTLFFILYYKPSFPHPSTPTPILVRLPLLWLVLALVLS